jgi:hypothetical protein
MAKPTGHCYPLSMWPKDDPASTLFIPGSRSLPKYTVKLWYAIRINAMTLEHQSFPVSRRNLEHGLKVGESTPQWVRLVGFTPCPPEMDGEGERNERGNDNGGCALRGFDTAMPINLGLFKYCRIMVTGREYDYGGGDNNNGDSDGRKGQGKDDPFSGGKAEEHPDL